MPGMGQFRTRALFPSSACRLACPFVATTSTWAGIGDARADTLYASEGAAYTGCMANAESAAKQPNASFNGCVPVTLGYFCYVTIHTSQVGCGTAYPTLYHNWHSYPEGQTCATVQAPPGLVLSPGTVRCSNGCEFALNPANTIAATGRVCIEPVVDPGKNNCCSDGSSTVSD